MDPDDRRLLALLAGPLPDDEHRSTAILNSYALLGHRGARGARADDVGRHRRLGRRQHLAHERVLRVSCSPPRASPLWAVVARSRSASGRRSAWPMSFVVVVLRIPSIIGDPGDLAHLRRPSSVAVSGNQILDARLQLSGRLRQCLRARQLAGTSRSRSSTCWCSATIIGVLLTQTAAGRYTYAVGLNPDVARNTGHPGEAHPVRRARDRGDPRRVRRDRALRPDRLGVARWAGTRTCCPRSRRSSWERPSSV